ncbi:MAG: putative bifunctional diguanylate cyclase/phosphodiesterase [Streptosporangiaceae bacterium]
MPPVTRVIVAGSVVGGVLTLFIAWWHQPAAWPAGLSQWLVAGVIGALLLVSWVWPIVVYRSGESETLHTDEGFFVILALLTGPLVVLTTLALACTLAQAARGRPLVKSAFNVGQILIAAGLGLAASRGAAVPSGRVSAGDVAAVALGAGVYFVVNALLVNGVLISLGTGWREFLGDLPVQLLLAGTGTLIGMIVALAIRAHLWALALAVPAIILQRRLISARYAALYDRARISGLYETALEANRGLHQQAVLDTITDAVRRLLRSPKAALTAAPPAPAELAVPVTVDGQERWLVASGRRKDEPFDKTDRGLLQALAAVGDGALRNAELFQQVRREREILSSITLNMGEGVCAIDADGTLTFANPAAAGLIALPPAGQNGGSTGPAPGFLLGPAEEAMRSAGTIRVDDASFAGRSGTDVPVAFTVSAVLQDGVPTGAVIAFRDITERKAFENELHYHACYDSLTGLANRRLLVERLDQALQRTAGDHKPRALVFVDVDRFKSVNDSLGHVTGDEFLAAIAARMRNLLREGDLLARFGGDEFVVLVEDVAGAAEALAIAQRLCVAVAQPLSLSDGYEMVASVSVGVALTDAGKTADDMLRDADVAMYEAKAKGGGCCKLFDQVSMGTRSPERLRIEADLRHGLERDELEVHYQPFYSLGEHRLVGAEALVRWRHPARGLLAPAAFIPMAEETGLILPLGRYVLEKVCGQLRSIRDNLSVDIPISVNLSPRQFAQSDLLSEVASALDAACLPSELLKFEITETMVMDDLLGAREIMKKLSRLGVRLAIDDFGTGHSSLAYLKQFPVHEVKVDRAFVQGVADSAVDSAIVRAVIDLATAIGISTVAEGVESADQVAELRALGCQVGQGFFFSRPLRADDFDALLTAHFGHEPAWPPGRPLAV